MEDKLVEMAIRLWMKDRDVFQWIKKFGEVVREQEEEIVVKGETGITCGFLLGQDPITQGVQLGFLVYGLYWPYLCPGLLEKVNREWKRRMEEK